MFKQEREKKINRDKKDKKIRYKLDLKNDTFERDKTVWIITPNCQNYSDVNKTKYLLGGINVKGLKLEQSKKNEDLMESKYNKPHKYQLYFSNFTNKKEKLYSCRGHNKGNTQRAKGASSIYGSHFAKQDCKSDEFSLVYNYKDNKPKNEFDPNKPVCIICYDSNCGLGRYIFKKCKHGTNLCINCAKKLDICPICRADRR